MLGQQGYLRFIYKKSFCYCVMKNLPVYKQVEHTHHLDFTFCRACVLFALFFLKCLKMSLETPRCFYL